jgi:hypothetical protein
MRKFLILAGLLAGVVMFSGTPAQAWVGCVCAKFGAPGVCMKGPTECAATSGACLLPCDYQQPKKAKMSKKKKPA